MPTSPRRIAVVLAVVAVLGVALAVGSATAGADPAGDPVSTAVHLLDRTGIHDDWDAHHRGDQRTTHHERYHDDAHHDGPHPTDERHNSHADC